MCSYFHDPRASLIGNRLYDCTWANKTFLQSFLMNRWHLFLESLLKTNSFHIHIDFQEASGVCLVAHHMDSKPIEVLVESWILLFVYFRLPRDEILVQTYLLVWL